jgi:hypothetical protein
VYFVDYSNYRIRKVAVSTNIITTVIGTGTSGSSASGLKGTSTNLGYTGGITTDSSGNLYYTDNTYNVVRVWSRSTSLVSTYMGSGAYSNAMSTTPITSARLNPYGIAIGVLGDIYITDTGNYVTWMVDGKRSNTVILKHFAIWPRIRITYQYQSIYTIYFCPDLSICIRFFSNIQCQVHRIRRPIVPLASAGIALQPVVVAIAQLVHFVPEMTINTTVL